MITYAFCEQAVQMIQRLSVLTLRDRDFSWHLVPEIAGLSAEKCNSLVKPSPASSKTINSLHRATAEKDILV